MKPCGREMDKKEPGDQGETAKTYDEEAFSRDAIARFPALRSEFEEHVRLVDVQIAVLANSVRQALSDGRLDFIVEVCEFLGNAVRNPRSIPAISQSVAFTFVEAWEFRETPLGEQALQTMPAEIRKILLHFDETEEAS